jgi:hypothetical protein
MGFSLSDTFTIVASRFFSGCQTGFSFSNTLEIVASRFFSGYTILTLQKRFYVLK